jgi:hypothetical protein
MSNVLKVENRIKNGYGLSVLECEANPPIQGHNKLNVAAWRTVDGRYVTAVIAPESENILSDCVGGNSAHTEAAQSIGYLIR